MGVGVTYQFCALSVPEAGHEEEVVGGEGEAAGGVVPGVYTCTCMLVYWGCTGGVYQGCTPAPEYWL